MKPAPSHPLLTGQLDPSTWWPTLPGSPPNLEELEPGKVWATWRLSGLAEFVALADTPQGRATHHDAFGRDSDPWRGTKTWEEAVNLARSGWPKGRDAMAGDVFALTMLDDDAADLSRYAWREEGVDFDVSRVLEGEPEHWAAPVLAPARRAWRVSCQFNMPDPATPEQCLHRGAAAVALARALEASGQIVELQGVVATDALLKPRSLPALVVVPLGLSPLDLASAAFVLAHAASPRRLSFALRASGVRKDRLLQTFGRPKQAPGYATDLSAQRVHLGTQELFKTMEAAKAWLLDILNRIERGAS